MIFRSAKSPPEPFPTHRPTNPFVRSLSWVTTRLGCFASPTKTLTLGLATTTRTWNQALGSGGTHGLLECCRPLVSQLLPCIGRLRYVLYGVAVPRRVFRAEVERTQVNRVVRRAIEPMKGDTDKALPLHVFASDVKLDGPVTELDPFEIRHALTGLLVEPDTLPGPIAQSTHAAVEDLDVLGLDGSLLSRDAGSSKQDDKSRHVHRRPLLLGSLVPQLLHIDTLATLHGRPNVYTGRRTWDAAVCPFPK